MINPSSPLQLVKMSDAAAASGHHSDDEEVTPGYVAPAKVLLATYSLS